MVEAHPTHHAMADKNLGFRLFPFWNPSLRVADKLAANGCQAHAKTLAMCSISREKPLSDASDIGSQPI